LVGNLTRDPELRYTGNNNPVLKFGIATTEVFVTNDGTKKENTQFHSVVMWGKRAEALGKILEKGRQVMVEGRIEHREYEKGGVKRYVTEINAQNLLLLGGGSRSGSGGGGGGGRPQGGGRPTSGGRPQQGRDEIPPDDFGSDPDDDIPM
jgi:single-strand DNA-binding protein